MAEAGRKLNRDRVNAAIGVVALHVLIGYAFLIGLGVDFTSRQDQSLKLFNIPEQPPPTPVPPTPPKEATRQQGAAAPPNLRAKATPVVAPKPKIKIPVPPPLIAAPLPVLAHGSEALAGATDRPGPGTGAGGEGTGTGSGGEGTGTGSGVAFRAQLVRGRLRNQDYPPAAMRVGAQGTVSVFYTVGRNGRVYNCRIVRSSGNSDLDGTTCRLIEQRFRYRPARNARGEPVEDKVGKTYDWILPYFADPPY